MASVSLVRYDGYLVKNAENYWTPEARPWYVHDTDFNPDFNKIPTHTGEVDLHLHYSYGVFQQKIRWEGYKMYPGGL